jgi:lipoprotein-anchoring transpeptidase ErfK/SrfK
MDEKKRRLLKVSGLVLSIGLLVEATGFMMGWRASRIQQADWTETKPGLVKILKSENALLKKRIRSFPPQGLYIVVDTADNLLYLNEGSRTLLKATISAGSGNILIDPSGERKWIFETPRGEFAVQSKFEKPTWIKPDWAFIEEGKPLPRNFGERIEQGVLGDYALGIGNGYFIHGTLYTRLLGKNITHGCIRVGDQDLKTLYHAVSLGTKVLIL